MNYLSTRGGMAAARFSDVALDGLASDGGLVVPSSIPRIDAETLSQWRSLAYSDLAAEVMMCFADQLGEPVVRALADQTYRSDAFGSAAITPLEDLSSAGDNLSLLRLSEGPTLAFKDVAMQWLGNLFEHLLEASQSELTILGATSGDTGSAAEYATRGKRRIQVFMLSPFGRMSPFQAAQMYSLDDANIHNIAVDGVFDQAQDIVKALIADPELRASARLGTVNSINWARIVAQVVYYFSGYFQATRDNGERVDFAVPTGNFGNVYSGIVARMMGLPIERLVCATNENDVLDEFFKTGRYRVRTAAETRQTSSPSMDISRASNFERFLYHAFGGDAKKVAGLMDQVRHSGGFDLQGEEVFVNVRNRFGLVSSSSSHLDRVKMIRSVHESSARIVDPHTADGLVAAQRHGHADRPMIVLETAQPAKFPSTITEAIGRLPDRPKVLADIESRPQRFTRLAADSNEVKDFVLQTLSKGGQGAR